MSNEKKPYRFSENNSGGDWWLSKEDYEKMFTLGWSYEANDYDKENGYDTLPFRAGDPVPYGWRHGCVGAFESLQAAVEAFEQATGQDFFAEGCNCCGAPFSISGPGEYMSGDSVERRAERPW